MNAEMEKQSAITALCEILRIKVYFPSPNGAELHFMNQFAKPRRSRYSWKDIGIIAAVILLVGGCSVGVSSLFLDAVGPECLVIHCVKVIR